MLLRRLLPLLLVLSLCLPALGQQETLEELSIRLAEQMEAEDFEQTMALFAPELKGQISAPQLQAGMQQARLLAGAHERIAGTNRLDTQTGPVIDVYARHSGKPMRLRFPYNDKGLLIGLWMQPVTWEELGVLFPQEQPQAMEDERGEEQRVEVGPHALPGSLTRPRDPAKRLPVAVLLLGGSGPTDRDGTVGEAANKPLRDLAMGLAARGISSLRYDKRSYAKPQSLGADVTIEQEVLEDADAAIALLGRSEWTRDSVLYVLGHSLGGMLVPEMLRRSPTLSGGIVLAGSPRSLWEIIFDQNEAAVAAMTDVTEEEKVAVMAGVAAMRDLAMSLPEGNDAAPFGMPGSYVRSLNALRLAQTAAALNQPLFILQGERDTQVSVKADFAAWQDLLGERENVTFHLYPGLNHLFMPAQTGSVDEYNLPAQVDGQVLDDIAGWLTARGMLPGN